MEICLKPAGEKVKGKNEKPTMSPRRPQNKRPKQDDIKAKKNNANEHSLCRRDLVQRFIKSKVALDGIP